MERQAKFQSTPLIRGETQSHIPDSGRDGISIHSPHTRGDRGCAGGMMELKISIHSPHTRGDPDHQTTGATRAISIHSPHTRGDRINLAGIQPHHRHFNPLPSYEGRPVKPSSTPQQPKVFQSTPLIRGETFGRDRDEIGR